jgi:hypothetical protein
MIRRVLVPVIVASGVGLSVAGASWKHWFPPQSYWSQEKARQLVDTSTKLHAMQDGQHGAEKGAAHSVPAIDTTALAAVKQQYESLQNELDRARSARNRTGLYVGALGLALVVLGILIFVKTPPPDPSERDLPELWRR